MRHEVFAHSDSHHFKFEPADMGDFQTTIESVPFAIISPEEAERIRVMTVDLIKATCTKLDELYRELATTFPNGTAG